MALPHKPADGDDKKSKLVKNKNFSLEDPGRLSILRRHIKSTDKKEETVKAEETEIKDDSKKASIEKKDEKIVKKTGARKDSSGRTFKEASAEHRSKGDTEDGKKFTTKTKDDVSATTKKGSENKETKPEKKVEVKPKIAPEKKVIIAKKDPSDIFQAIKIDSSAAKTVEPETRSIKKSTITDISDVFPFLPVDENTEIKKEVKPKKEVKEEEIPSITKQKQVSVIEETKPVVKETKPTVKETKPTNTKKVDVTSGGKYDPWADWARDPRYLYNTNVEFIENPAEDKYTISYNDEVYNKQLEKVKAGMVQPSDTSLFAPYMKSALKGKGVKEGYKKMYGDDYYENISKLNSPELVRPAGNEFDEYYIPTLGFRTQDDYSSKVDKRPLNISPAAVILHHTAFMEDDLREVLTGLVTKANETGAHMLISNDGTRVRLADTNVPTFHAGKSRLFDREGVNDFSLGIEFQGDTTMKPLTEAQIRSAIEYLRPILAYHELTPNDIFSHENIRNNYYDKNGWDKYGKVDITPEQLERVVGELIERLYVKK